MHNRFFYYIIRPHQIIKKIILKIENFFKRKNYDFNFFQLKQNNLFKKYGLIRDDGLENILQIQNRHQFLKDEMSSEHQIFFSALSLSKNSKIREILEIGTWDAKNAYLLSLLFKNANIETIDLSKDHEIFTNSYNRFNKVDKFIEDRDKIISMEKRIFFRELNSLRLYDYQKKYDLIWIDGAHGYPVACIDIINSLKLINSNGMIMCDDVFINKIESDKIYKSTASFETLEELKRENIIDYELIYKRLDIENNFDTTKRKFVAIVTKL